MTWHEFYFNKSYSCSYEYNHSFLTQLEANGQSSLLPFIGYVRITVGIDIGRQQSKCQYTKDVLQYEVHSIPKILPRGVLPYSLGVGVPLGSRKYYPLLNQTL